MWDRRAAAILAFILLASQPASSRVFIRWSEPVIPSLRTLGIADLVISWRSGHSALFEAASKQGYHVYAEVTPEQAQSAAAASAGDGLAGIIVKAPGTGPTPESTGGASGIDGLIRNLRSAHSGLSVWLLEPGGKQPEMKGSMVVNRNGVLEVSSPTQQPWIDSNVALIRFERVYRPSQAPLISFEWTLTDSLEQKYGPPPQDYELAVAEAGAFRASLILPLHKYFQDGLAQGKPETWKAWRAIQRYIRFYQATEKRFRATHQERSEGSAPSIRNDQPRWFAASSRTNERVPAPFDSRSQRTRDAEPITDVGVVTNDYGSAYEAMNLMARHNIPFRVIKPEWMAAGRLNGLALIVVFSPIDGARLQAMDRFAKSGRTAVLVGQRGNFPWRATQPIRKSTTATVYKVETGRVVEVAAPIVDPEPFARDVWRLLRGPERGLSLWNALTTLAAAYPEDGASGIVINLVNYSGDPVRVQARVKGRFSQIRYETPERGCCVTLAPAKPTGPTGPTGPAGPVGPKGQGSFTEFVVPWLRTGGRVHLGEANF